MLKQQLQQKQQLQLSPQQVMLAQLLEAPIVELEEIVKQNLEDNPALEEGRNDDEDWSFEADNNKDEGSHETSEEITLADYASEDDIPDYRLQSDNQFSKGVREEIPFAETSTLLESLLEQLRNKVQDDLHYQLGEYIIASLDDDGYLRRSLDQILDDLAFGQGIDVSIETLEEMLDVIQEFEPAGIAARSIQECLLNQIERSKYSPSREKAYLILKNNYCDFEEHRYEKIKQEFGFSEEDFNEALNAIRKLNPKPASGFVEGGEGSLYINPEFIVELDDNDEPIVSLINPMIPELRISKTFTNMLTDYSANEKNRNTKSREALLYIKQKMDAASGFINAIKQRQNTLFTVMQAIVSYQKQFFITGDETQLRPLVQRDIAKVVGFDESTVSRVTKSRYVLTEYGTFPLKFFFKDYLTNDNGEEMTFEAVKAILWDIIKEEDRNQPLNDTQLAEMMSQRGYTVARRTIVKYRQQLNIEAARVRKEYYALNRN